MKRSQIPQKLVYEKFYMLEKKFSVHEIAAVDLSKIHFLKNPKETCKPSNRDLNRDWKKWHYQRIAHRQGLKTLLISVIKISTLHGS